MRKMLHIILIASCISGLILTVTVLLFLLYRASKKLIMFDDLFSMLCDDIETNLRYFAKLASTPVLSNSSEIQAANHNMMIMGVRLNEYLTRMEELTSRRLRTVVPSPNPPVVK